MRVDLQDGTVRILKPDGSTAGTGFVVKNNGLIATCVHVVQAAGAMPNGQVSLTFHRDDTPLKAKVVPGGWHPSDDIAFLKLAEPESRGLAAVTLGSACGSNGHRYQALGYPEDGEVQARWPQGRISGMVPVDGYNTELVQIQGTEVDRGLSGAPVLDLDTNSVIGMVIAYQDSARHENAPQVRFAYAVPAETLHELCPEDLPQARQYHPDLSTNPIAWSEVVSIGQEKNHVHLGSMREKYEHGPHVERKQLQQEIMSFLNSDQACYLVLNGRSGMGKTGVLCRLIENVDERPNYARLVYDCSKVTDQEANRSLLYCLFERFSNSLDETSIDTLLNRIEVGEGFNNQKNRLIIVVDAINENKNIDAIIRQIAKLQSKKCRPWIKTIISCRPHFWPQLRDRMIRGSTDMYVGSKYFHKSGITEKHFLEIHRFTREEAQEAYKKYQNRYNFNPEQYDNLDPILQRRLREPLLLWLVSEIYQDAHIAPDAASSDISIIPTYTEKLLEKRHYEKTEIGKMMNVLNSIIPQKMVRNGNCHNAVPHREIASMPKGIRETIELFVKFGVLEKDGDDRIRFRYERFYDYHFGRALWKLVDQNVKLDCKPEETN